MCTVCGTGYVKETGVATAEIPKRCEACPANAKSCTLVDAADFAKPPTIAGQAECKSADFTFKTGTPNKCMGCDASCGATVNYKDASKTCTANDDSTKCSKCSDKTHIYIEMSGTDGTALPA